jgi:serine/threonine protein phosphatase PrpC
MPDMLVYPYTHSKEGNAVEENEDAFSIPDIQNENALLRIAIADGATESSFSEKWAKILVDHFYVFDYSESSFSTAHPIFKRLWLKSINVQELPWYAQEKLELGSFSSFLGLDMDRETGNTTIIAVGDSNFFHFRDEQLQHSFPIKQSIDFGNRPFLISTEAWKNKHTPLFAREECVLAPGDLVLLGTDAISHWILKEIETTGYHSITALMHLLQQQDGETALADWVHQRRHERTMKNDDTTLILIKIV